MSTSTLWTTEAIREQFIRFFEERGHARAMSAPIVVKNDPTLMFTNAGMNQWKGIFLGSEKAPSARVANSQKCLRVSGKHNDLEEVGHDHYHHTMFEMLGNWSFGDYFKMESIAWAWELLTKVYGIDADRLYVSVFAGDEAMQVDFDKEAADEWAKWIEPERILPFGRKDNFWEMGETGPCGPCTEIHVDLRPPEDRTRIEGSALVNTGHPEVIEIWNLVFIQFNRLENGSLKQLDQKHVDTGMGLERLARTLQAVAGNYETDVFKRIIKKVMQETGETYSGSSQFSDVAFRVIADHIRAVGFCIADGQLPSNTGAGYVVRRVLRRAVRYAYSYLGVREPILYKVFNELAESMGAHYTELSSGKEFVAKVIQEEERTFLTTLAKGLQRLESKFGGINTGELEGAFAFELFDTYGFPIDLTTLIAAEHGMTVDQAGFQKLLTEQRKRSQADAHSETGDWMVLVQNATTRFVGYDELEVPARISQIRKARDKHGEHVQAILTHTPFYAESGGQVGDTGWLEFGEEQIAVTNTKKENGEWIHFLAYWPSNPKAEFVARVDADRRSRISAHHTATHLLHLALRRVLGTHVEQKGSLVSSEKLRFDFSHFAKLSQAELKQVSEMVDQQIRASLALVERREMEINAAKAEGAMALFGEKYGDSVRVIRFGDSVELCGGTHVKNTAELVGFHLSSETAVAAGTRRIEATAGACWLEFINQRLAKLEAIEALIPGDSVGGINQLKEEVKQQRQTIEMQRGKMISQLLDELIHTVSKTEALLFETHLNDLDAKEVKDIAMKLVAQFPNKVLTLAVNGDRPQLAVALGESVDHSISAAALIKVAAQYIEGSGGGQRHFAMASGKNEKGLKRALESIQEELSKQLRPVG